MPGWQREAMGWPAFSTPGAFDPTATRAQELAALRDQAGAFERALAELRARIRTLESSATDVPKATDTGNE